ncbi:MAG TPA: carboxypeptidase regulatory-like domain-containing protein [Gemmatimonadaceae bacterium]|jgi:hypothetical protein
MTRSLPPRLRGVLYTLLATVSAALLQTVRLQAQTAGLAKPSPGFAAMEGYILDSLHDVPLANARIMVEGANRAGVTDGVGHYHIDSIPAGEYSVQVLHPLLDTLGLAAAFRTPTYPFAVGVTRDFDLSIPPAQLLATLFCNNSPKKVRGPAAMVGFVRDPDTKAAAVGAKVELVFYNVDLIGRKTLVTGQETVDSTGIYHLCGLPQGMTGKVQVFRNGVTTGEVPVETTGGYLAMRGFTVGSATSQTVAVVKSDSGKVKRVALGSAVLTGKVVNKKGDPLGGARVTLQGQFRTVVASPNGTFKLDSLPSGTQSVEVRRLGYSFTEVPVELASNSPATTTITMSDAVPMLAQVTVEAQADVALAQIGYSDRKKSSTGGYFLDGDAINHNASEFSVVMTAVPGLGISPVGDGRTNKIVDNRTAGGCVNYWVDGTQYPSLTPGDIDDYVRPGDMVAVEVYHSSDIPPQFMVSGQGSCLTIVVWTQAKLDAIYRRNKKLPGVP